MTRPDCGCQTNFGVCHYPRAKGKQRCVWHWLLAQSSDVQAEHARARLKAWVDEFSEIRRYRVPSDEWPSGERWCSGCQSYVPLFYVSGSRCKACNSSAAHEKRLETTYGLTPEQYQEIWKRQGGRCAICRNKPRTIRFAVDHDHKTGENRGILCKRCNHDLLGGGHDDVVMLWRAISYLLFPPARGGQKPTTADVIEALQARLDIRGRLVGLKAYEPEKPPF